MANLIVPLDGSELSRTPIPLVCRLIEIYGATPHVLYAGEQSGPDTMLARLGIEWQKVPGAVLHETTGIASESILRLAKELPLAVIVMCTNTGHNRKPNCFGSVTEAVLAGDPQRLLLVAPEYQRPKHQLKRILLAHDGTPASAVAVGPAADLAFRAGAEVLAIHVAAPRSGGPRQSGSLPAPRYVDHPQYEWPSWAAEFGARLLALGMPESSTKFKVIVAGGQVGSELAQYARKDEVDMVVLANSGDWKGCTHSIARVVIERSGCPVLLVRPGESGNASGGSGT
ncbi:MAG: universal stress protein [Acidobacteriaceae bacterium]